MAGQVLRMNVNGRLTAPPEVEVALVTNSVDDMEPEGRSSRPTAGGTTLASFSTGPGMRMREERRNLYAGARAAEGAHGLGWLDPVSATHVSIAHVFIAQDLSVSQEAAAGS
jgi:hypothetical protein